MKNSKLGESTFHNKPQLSTFLNTLNTTTDKQSVVSVPNQQDSFLLSKIVNHIYIYIYIYII